MKRFWLAWVFLFSLLATPASAQGVTDGIAAYNRGEFSAALAIWGPLAEQGDRHAQASLGLLFARGQGVARDYGEAFKWFQLSAEQGYAIAQNNLGAMYRNGYGVRQDYERAASFYLLSAAQGYPLAQHSLGVMYENGEGLRPDLEEAYMWYTLAAEQGHSDALIARQALSVLITDKQQQQALLRASKRRDRNERVRLPELPPAANRPQVATISEPAAGAPQGVISEQPESPPEATTNKPTGEAPEVVVKEQPESPTEAAANKPTNEAPEVVIRELPEPPPEVATGGPPQASPKVVIRQLPEPPEVATSEPPRGSPEVVIRELPEPPLPEPPLPEPPLEVGSSELPNETPESEPAPPEMLLSPSVEIAAIPPIVPAAENEEGAWRIQLTSMRKREEAEEVWLQLLRANPHELNGMQFHVQPAELSNGTFYRVQAGPLADSAAASSLCETLKARNQECIIVAP